MSESSEASYSDGEVVWVKLGNCWWPGEVCGVDSLPPGLLKSFRKPPIAVVKFFQEESFEYVKNNKFIFKYNCTKKNDFIKKGLDLFRSKHSHMEKFPEDVSTAERKTNGDPDIINSEEFQPQKKESYANIFGSSADSLTKNKAGKRGRPSGTPAKSKNKTNSTPSPKITHPRILQKYLKGSSDYEARILVASSNDSPPQSLKDFEMDDYEPERIKPTVEPTKSSPMQTVGGMYTCPSCNFSAKRLNVMILHSKSHSAGYVPYTPVKTPKTKPPARQKAKSATLPTASADDDDYEIATTSKRRKTTANSEKRSRGRPRNLMDGVNSEQPEAPPKIQTKNDAVVLPPKRKMKHKEREPKKAKTDVEIKNSLLADWNEDSEEDMDVLSSLKLSHASSESKEEIQDSPEAEAKPASEKSAEDNETEKIDKPRDQTSCFDFEEDEDLKIENIGRKIPRVSNKADEFKKSMDSTNINDILSKDKPSPDANVKAPDNAKPETDFSSEIDNLLNETKVPDLPPIPSNSNFQAGKVVKVPDKPEAPTGNTIFKTKTFFRSRHSRSQDAIEKYVADNTSVDKPPTYMNESVEPEPCETASDLNDSLPQNDVPPKTEPVRIAKYAPKIQLKKLNAANKNKTIAEDATESKLDSTNKNDATDDAKLSNGQNSHTEPVLNENVSNEQIADAPKCDKENKSEPSEDASDDISKSKLYQILDESSQKTKTPFKIISSKVIKPQGKEKILNFGVGASESKQATFPQKQKIIIKRAVRSDDKFPDDSIVLCNKPADKWSEDNVQTFTIEESGGSTDLQEPTLKKVNPSFSKPHNTIITSSGEIIQSNQRSDSDIDASKMIKPDESSTSSVILKHEPPKKSIIFKSLNEKSVSPNILSKSPKSKTLKHILIIDKNTNERKIVNNEEFKEKMLKSEDILKQATSAVTPKKVIINSKLGVQKNQKFVISPSADTSVIIGRLGESGEPEVYIPKSQSNDPMMILANQGSQSKKIVLTSDQTLSLPKGKIIAQSSTVKKPIVQILNSNLAGVKPNQEVRTVLKQKGTLLNSKGQIIIGANKRPILTGQAILTSKGQLIAPQSTIINSSGKILNTGKPSIITPQKIVRASQSDRINPSTLLLKSTKPPVQGQTKESIFLSQKPGTIMHLTAAQFEQLQKTGRLISTQKAAPGKTAQKFIIHKVIKNPDAPQKVPSTPVPQIKEQYSAPSETVSDADDLIPASIIPRRKEVQKTPQSDLKTDRPSSVREQKQPETVEAQPAPVTSEPQKQLLAIPGENFGGPPNSFFLCVEDNGTLTPIDNQPLILENDQLVPMNMASTLAPEPVNETKEPQPEIPAVPANTGQTIILNIENQDVMIDQQSLLTLLTGENQQLVTNDGQQLVFQGNTQQIISALASNPEVANLLAGGQQILLNAPNTDIQPNQTFTFPTEVQPNNQDILAAALAGTEVFQPDPLTEAIDIATTDTERMIMEIDSLSPNVNIAAPVVHSNVFETSSTLNQPIMSPLEIPTKKRADEVMISPNSQSISKNLDDSLAVIGVTTPNVPSSLELPITVTNPRIASNASSLVTTVYASSVLNNTVVSPSVFKSDTISDSFITEPEKLSIGSSMPCLDDSSSEGFLENARKKQYSPISMPILTDDALEAPTSSEPISMPIIAETENLSISEFPESLPESESTAESTTNTDLSEIQVEPPKSEESICDSLSSDAIESVVDEVNDVPVSNSAEPEALMNNVEPVNNVEPDEICADTPPHMMELDSVTMYDADPVVEPSINEADGNSLPDDNVTCSDAVPDSISPNLDTEPDVFSESSNSSAEIPIQPTISVSHTLVENFMLNPDSDR